MHSLFPKHLSFSFDKGKVFRDFQQINKRKAKKETVQQIVGAKVLYANYPLLMHDFPQLTEGALLKKLPFLNHLPTIQRRTKIQEIIDLWILKHSAYISTKQAGQTNVNSPIPTNNLKTEAYRPTNYGRALVFSIEETNKVLGADVKLGESLTDKGLIDVKGVGVAPNVRPQIGVHDNGLISLSDCFEALIMEQIIHRIFKHQGVIHETLPFYAIIDIGFKEIYPSREWSEEKKEEVIINRYRPAGLLLRRAHNRQRGAGDLPKYGTHKHQATMDIELLLRKYGITSTGLVTTVTINTTPDGKSLIAKYGDRLQNLKDKEFINYLQKFCQDKKKPVLFEGVNVQLTEDLETNPLKATLVDFGQYNIRGFFEHPILFLAAYRPLFWGGAMWPNDPRYVQPFKKLAIDPALWKGENGIFDFPAKANKTTISVFSEGLTDALQTKQITRSQFVQYIFQYIDAAVQPKPLWKVD